MQEPSGYGTCLAWAAPASNSNQNVSEPQGCRPVFTDCKEPPKSLSVNYTQQGLSPARLQLALCSFLLESGFRCASIRLPFSLKCRASNLDFSVRWELCLSLVIHSPFSGMFSRFLGQLSVAVVAVTPLVSCGPTSLYDVFPRTPAEGIDLQPLAPSLSVSARIYLPENSEFATHTVRWSNLEPPTPNVVIAPGTEDDVAKIVGPCRDVHSVHTTSNLLYSRSSSRQSGTSRSLHTMVTMVL